MTVQSVQKLAAVISKNAAILNQQVVEKNLVPPTVNDISPPNFLELDDATSKELIQAARELQTIVQGPSQVLSILGFAQHDISSLGVLLQFNIPNLVPFEGSISFRELAEKTGVLEDKLTRVLRYAFTNFIFREHPEGHVSHTALSAALAKDPRFATFLRLVMVDLFPPVATLAESFEKYPQSEVPTETAMNVAFNTKEPFFSWLQQDKARRERFNVGMAGFSDGGDRPQSVDVKAYPWQRLPKGATVVDVGGGSGHVSKALAESFPSFTVIVQDASEVVEQSNVALAAAQAEGRLLNVSFQEHNFFSPQPVKDADVYFLRQIMHDWPKKEAAMILRALLPALKPGARVVVSEYVIPPPGRLTGLDDKMIRQMDLQMMAMFNAKERTADEFVELFAEASPTLKFEQSYQVSEDQKSCIFEAVYSP